MSGVRESVVIMPVILGAVPDETRPHCTRFVVGLRRPGGATQRCFWRMLEGRAHAALVFDGDEAIAWAEYGTVDELPNVRHRKEWQTVEQVPDFRITCLFVDRRYRRNGLAEVAVRRALAFIAAAGGGRVESYPPDLPPDKRYLRRSSATPPARCTSGSDSATNAPKAWATV
jgi:GNAT superfamily N-acetyltransferase